MRGQNVKHNIELLSLLQGSTPGVYTKPTSIQPLYK